MAARVAVLLNLITIMSEVQGDWNKARSGSWSTEFTYNLVYLHAAGKLQDDGILQEDSGRVFGAVCSRQAAAADYLKFPKSGPKQLSRPQGNVLP